MNLANLSCPASSGGGRCFTFLLRRPLTFSFFLVAGDTREALCFFAARRAFPDICSTLAVAHRVQHSLAVTPWQSDERGAGEMDGKVAQ
jgi:hypothetical protein